MPVTTPQSAAILASKEPILGIGDSVMLASSPALTATFGTKITVDAVVGRQVTDGITRLQEYKTSGQLARYKTVVIDLGTNGPMTPANFDQLAALLKGVPNVVFYNAYVSRPWEATTNSTLQSLVPAHPGWILLNWTAVAPTPGFLYPDGIHPDPTGATAYASLLDTALINP